MKKAEVASITKLSKKQDESFISSSYPELDAIMGGGFPRGRVTEVSGNEGVGKTYLVTKLMASLSKDYKILFCDAEFSLNKDRVNKLGANPENIDYYADSRLEDVAEQITKNIGKYDVIILDSLASLIPMTIENQEVGESSNIGLFSRLIKQFVMKMRPQLGRSQTALIVINQMRKGIGPYVKNEPPGGMAWSHVCDIRLRLSANNSKDKIESGGVRTGHWVRAECTKNKCAPPHINTKFKLEY